MTITIAKPRPDLGENMEEHIKVELSDEDIRRIGRRYFELTNTVIIAPYSAYNDDGSIKINQC